MSVLIENKIMPGNLHREALSIFKKLHRTRLKTFHGDDHALQVTRQRLNDEFRKHKDLTNESAIKERIKFAKEIEHEVRATVIQVIQKEPGKYEARITPDNLVDNAEYGREIHESQFKRVTKCSDPIKK